MLLLHPDRPAERVRLGYCLNVHPAEDLAQALAGMRAVTLALRERLVPGAPFGVGLYLPAALAHALDAPTGRADLEELAGFLAAERLDPFTANAFPYGGFHRSGLKRDVFRPTWAEPERADFTLAVARILVALAQRVGECGAPRGHLSLSTHAGRFGRFGPGDGEERAACAAGLARTALELARLEEREGLRVVLSLEAEPRSSANDTAEVAAWIAEVRAHGPASLAAKGEARAEEVERALARHLGTCLDACHSAVEFEEPARALELATRSTLGKLQFSSALALERPALDAAGRALLLGLDEPRYLHQVTGRGPAGLVRTEDLAELARALEHGPEPWLACDEWRCHFHVPIGLETLGAGLGTTVGHADRLLAGLLADGARWGGEELHVELETYTWDVLPNAARGAGERLDGLEREMRHALARLARAGWHPA